ncbi:MAG: DUF3108 domain-containing protein [Luteibaculaceae bacterium]
MRKFKTYCFYFFSSLVFVGVFLSFTKNNLPANEKKFTLPSVENNAFKVGEKLTYRIHYGYVDAGEAVVTLKESNRRFNGRKVIHAVGDGYTLGAFNWFFKVDDRYETYLDEKGIFPWLFYRRIEEGGYKKQQDYQFFQDLGKVKTQKDSIYSIEPGTHDMLSSFYFARTLDFTHAKVGDIFTIPSFIDDKNYPLQIKFKGREVLKTRAGKFNTLKFVPVVQKGRIFKSEDDLQVWVTDDVNKIPLQAQAKILVGSIKVTLVDYENLVGPISKVK